MIVPSAVRRGVSERVQWADEEVVRERLESHLISYDLLSKAHYGQLSGDALKTKLQTDFNEFLRDRAELVLATMRSLADRKEPTIAGIWESHKIPTNITA
jgi:hypothetical protein